VLVVGCWLLVLLWERAGPRSFHRRSQVNVKRSCKRGRSKSQAKIAGKPAPTGATSNSNQQQQPATSNQQSVLGSWFLVLGKSNQQPAIGSWFLVAGSWKEQPATSNQQPAFTQT
jgi:hypothetical protein